MSTTMNNQGEFEDQSRAVKKKKKEKKIGKDTVTSSSIV
jgi:hypothetical protein